MGLLRRAIDLTERAARQAPGGSDVSRYYRNHLAGHLCLLARQQKGDAAERMGSLQRARQVYEELAKAEPEEIDYPLQPGRHRPGDRPDPRETGRPDLARESFLRALEGAERIAREAPHVILFKALLAQSLSGLAGLLHHEGDNAGALEPPAPRRRDHRGR